MTQPEEEDETKIKHNAQSCQFVEPSRGTELSVDALPRGMPTSPTITFLQEDLLLNVVLLILEMAG